MELKIPIKLKQAVIVEGRYDKIKLSQLLDAVIIETNGFRIFKDREKRDLIRTLAHQTGIIILTDSDAAGFKIRNHIKSITAGGEVIQVYIPQICGKEKRKPQPSEEGYLGVEGIDIQTLYNEFVRSGAFSDKEESFGAADSSAESGMRKITRIDFFEDGLSGGVGSKKKRIAIMKKLGLPTYLSADALLKVLNTTITYEEYKRLIEQED